MTKDKYDILLARFPGNGSERMETVSWMLHEVPRIMANPRVGRFVSWSLADTPITMGRNRSINVARDAGVDFILMVDSDMAPDLYHPQFQDAKPFVASSLAKAIEMREAGTPCFIGAPYCGPPPQEEVYVFEWKTHTTDNPNPDGELGMIPRDWAARLRGFTEVAALPTGLILIDMEGLAKLPPPYFEYEWKGDGTQCQCCRQPLPGTRADKASTEDVFFSRNFSLAGVPQLCNWDAWAGHVKTKLVGKPRPRFVDDWRKELVDAVRGNIHSTEHLRDVGT